MKNSWITSIRDLEKLLIVPPPGFVGTLAFAVLFTRDNMAGTAAQGLLIVDVNPITRCRAEDAGHARASDRSGCEHPFRA